MEGLKKYITILENLRIRARRLTADSLSLSNLFAEEAVRLSWKDEASLLDALNFSIRQQVDQAKNNEDAASYGYSKASLMMTLGRVAVGGTIKMLSRNKGLLAFSDGLLNSLGGGQRPFGMVLICVGPRGMPDDVRVVCISRLARESKLQESEVINELQRCGCLLFNEKAFSLLIDKLTDDVQKGRLVLPISTEKLAEIRSQTSIRLKPET
jgi:hypothetical protein